MGSLGPVCQRPELSGKRGRAGCNRLGVLVHVLLPGQTLAAVLPSLPQFLICALRAHIPTPPALSHRD